MPVSRLTYKYQATIPKQVREALALAAGDYVQFNVNAGGEVSLRKAVPEDRELQALEATLAPEWASPNDDEAYADL
jgi:AbrB family looped-hinge helix DNA binding protein